MRGQDARTVRDGRYEKTEYIKVPPGVCLEGLLYIRILQMEKIVKVVIVRKKYRYIQSI